MWPIYPFDDCAAVVAAITPTPPQPPVAATSKRPLDDIQIFPIPAPNRIGPKFKVQRFNSSSKEVQSIAKLPKRHKKKPFETEIIPQSEDFFLDLYSFLSLDDSIQEEDSYILGLTNSEEKVLELV